MHQGLNQNTVLNPDFLIEVQGKIDALIMNGIAFRFELVAPDITFIENRTVDLAISHKIAAGQV